MPKYVTIKQLEDAGACTPAKMDFLRLFPSGRVYASVENVRRARDYGLPVSWISRKLLTPEAIEAWGEGRRVAGKRYIEAREATWASAGRTTPEQYRLDIDAGLDEYGKACDRALVEAYRSQP